jgi:hypothetical protein
MFILMRIFYRWALFFCRLNEDYKKFNRSYEQKQAQIVASVVTTTCT